MKLLSAFLLVTLGLNSFAQDAKEIFNKRGEDRMFAKQAADLYLSAANAQTDNFKELEQKSNFAHAMYYFAQTTSVKKDQIALHNEAITYLAQSLNKVGVDVEVQEEDDDTEVEYTSYPSSLSDEQKLLVAKALFEYGANLGKYGEAKGITSSLSQLPKLEGAMHAIERLGLAHIGSYGVDRVLSRVEYKVPLRDKKLAYKKIKNAVDNTLHPEYGVSTYGLNNVYLAAFYKGHPNGKAAGKVASCKLLKKFVTVDPTKLNTARIPETKNDLAAAKSLIAKLKCN